MRPACPATASAVRGRHRAALSCVRCGEAPITALPFPPARRRLLPGPAEHLSGQPSQLTPAAAAAAAPGAAAAGAQLQAPAKGTTAACCQSTNAWSRNAAAHLAHSPRQDGAGSRAHLVPPGPGRGHLVRLAEAQPAQGAVQQAQAASKACNNARRSLQHRKQAQSAAPSTTAHPAFGIQGQRRSFGSMAHE